MNGLYDEVKIALHAVWRQRWLALAVAWGVALLGWLIIALIPNSYESVARVQVQNQSMLTDAVGISAGDQQGDIDRVRSALLSVTNLQKVVLATDLMDTAGTDAAMAENIGMVRQAVTVKALPDNLFEISARIGGGGRSDASNARLARQVVQQLVEIFASENVAGSQAEAGATLTFLNQELARRAQQLSEAEQKRVAFQQKYMGLLPGVGSFEQRAEQARVELNQIDSELIAARSALSAMSGQMAGTPATIAAPNYGGSGVPIGGARGRIAALEAQLSDAAARGWTDQHPDVIAARAQIARLRPDAAREAAGGGGAGSMPNPAYASLRSMQADRQATVSALASRRAQLQADMAAFTSKQASEPGVAAEQDRLNRGYDVLKAQYDKLLQDREQIQLRSDVSTKTDAVRVQVMDPPSAPQVPAAPKRPLLLIGILIVALGAGIGVAFAKGQLTSTYPTAAKLAAATGLPVLGAVSEVVTPAQAVLRRKYLMRFAGGVGGLFACFLLLMAIEFIQRGMVA
ncbi:MAG TPA: XrtA system polysaccharide chain length determinant [Sphingomonas sp.]|jgi:polysaccharide chain length determinant protein (PEP-CTERM system associated)|uniref:XrtA system polysaccharide chain length determinant n=1 Tax=Sphingomonas sp. TaxID=28214 RepID=UPI002ED8B6D0